MSPQTWPGVQVPKSLAKMNRKAAHHVSNSANSAFIDGSKHALIEHSQRAMSPQWHDTIFRVIVQLKKMLLWTLYSRRSLHPLARQMNRNDRAHTATPLADSFLAAAHGRNPSGMFRALRPLLGQVHCRSLVAFRPIPAVRMRDNQMALHSKLLTDGENILHILKAAC